MFAFLKRFIVLLIGLLLIVAIIWIAGPYFAFGTSRPLETEMARLIAIGIVIGLWFLWRLYKRLRAFRASDRLLAAVVKPKAQPEPERLPADVVKLRERFDEAVTALQQQRKSGHSLYELPWYVIIGAPGSGKTTALRTSGLNFPLDQKVGKEALRGIGGTRNCDWLFTDEAVFLDTAGRYLTQDSDQSSDSAGWAEFLALLKKYRARRPINGVILTVNAPDLLTHGGATRDAHLDAARNRLDELNRELGIQLPVYLMVTKCDLVDGFVEYFDDLSAPERAQVWGVTFPYEDSVANEAAQTFPAEFDALIARLNDRVFDRVEAVRDPRRRAKIFAFPQQMGTMRESLAQFVRDVFDTRQFDGRLLLRGVYFTSGTQLGTPIDRLLGSLGRSFGAGGASAAPTGPGKAYFVQSLLKDVMLGESGLAGINRRLEARKAALQLAAYVGMGLVAVAGVVILTYSYNRNREFLEQMRVQVDDFAKVPTVTAASPPDQILPRLDGIRAIVDSANQFRAGTSWLLAWGLYQGASIGDEAGLAYAREVDSTLLPRLGGHLRDRVRDSYANPERLFLYLKAYRMLGEPDRFDKEYIKTIVGIEWAPERVGPAISPGLLRHFQLLLDRDEKLRPLPTESTLIAQASSTIRQTSMGRIIYAGMKRDDAAATGRPELRLDQVAGLEVQQVFRRKSGVALSAPLPLFFTRDAFRKFAKTGPTDIIALVTRDSWVWGESTVSAVAGAGRYVAEVTALYEKEYIAQWDGLLEDLTFIRPQSVAEATRSLQLLTSPASPLRSILNVAREHTTLVETAPAAESSGAISELQKKIGGALGAASKAVSTIAGMPTGQPGVLVTGQFQWVRQLMTGPQGQTPLDGIMATLLKIQQELETLGPDVAGRRPAEVLSSQSFRGLIQSLRQQTATMPPVLRDLLSEIGEGGEETVVVEASSAVRQQYEQQIVAPCMQTIAGRYPFANASQDVQLTDFGAVFGSGGAFDRFFTEHLEKHVDTSTRPWGWRPGAIRASSELLAQFEAAAQIRDMFFPAGAKIPDVPFFVTITDLDRGSDRFVLQVDGQTVDNKHEAPTRKPLKWPVVEASGQAITTFEARFYTYPRAIGGPWALFRLIDSRGGDSSVDAQQRLRLNVSHDGHQATVTIEAARAVNNPFTTRVWRQFTCRS